MQESSEITVNKLSDSALSQDLSTISANNESQTSTTSHVLDSAFIESEKTPTVGDSEEITPTTSEKPAETQPELNAVVQEDNSDHLSVDDGTKEQEDDEIIGQRRPKKINLIDSDSEDDCGIHTDEQITKTGLADLYDSESSEDENQVENTTESLQSQVKSRLYDSESSDEETGHKSSSEEFESTESAPANSLPITPQQAEEQRKEIQSESQRRTRESYVSLPYHRPKQRSITEFLKNRSRISSTLPGPSEVQACMPIKMSKQQLVVISKNLRKRKKEVKLFYKSESESDDNEDENEETQEILPSNANEGDPNEIQRVCGDLVTENASDFNGPLPVKNCDVDVRLVSDAVDSINQISNTEEHQIIVAIPDAESETIGQETCEDKTDDSSGRENVNILLEKYSEPQKTSERTTESVSKQVKYKFLDINVCSKKPVLTGAPDDVIDLSEQVCKSDIVKELQERFFKHSFTHTTKPKSSEPDETPQQNGDEAPIEQNRITKQKLRDDLQSKILQQRIEQLKTQEITLQNPNACTSDGKELDFEEDILEDEDFSDETDGELTEDEDFADDDDQEERSRGPASEFLDAEADEDEDVSDGDGSEIDSIEPKNRDDETQGGERTERRRKRIVSAVEDASDHDSNGLDACNDTSVTLNEDDLLPPHQPQVNGTPKSNLTQANTNLDFLSPLINLTALQSNSGTSEALEKTPKNLYRLELESSPLWKDNAWKSGTQKKLFGDSPDLNEQTKEVNELNRPQEHAKDVLSTQEILGICSGTFTETLATPTTQDVVNICSGTFQTCENTSTTATKDVIVESKVDENDQLFDRSDTVISQLLNDDELESFRKKIDEARGFESDESASDSEEDASQVKRRAIRPLISDDEDSENEDEDVSEHDIVDDNKIVDYDSEENEMELEANDNNIVKHASDFFENEAELSESEWDSDDEDEKGLDVLELEQGDAEKFDEQKIRTDLEKIHMRQVLDDDNREVKILQELLLENGELTGSGRNRQFKWKNINSTDDGTLNRGSDDEQLDETVTEETEEMWRKRRHEREIFLEKEVRKTTQVETEEEITLTLESESQILTLGRSVLRKSIVTNTTSETLSAESPKLTTPFLFQNKRGSFLARDEQTLTKLAESIRTSTGDATHAKKNFVFQPTEVIENIAPKLTNFSNKRTGANKNQPAVKRRKLIDTVKTDSAKK